ncbi:hypothetical protein GGS24DRAFT_370903 [Hypoxylon argillaceum]|nr:hypothetical protein GGS24DRAFT_370903 [Hypoxylon argillaceum]
MSKRPVAPRKQPAHKLPQRGTACLLLPRLSTSRQRAHGLRAHRPDPRAEPRGSSRGASCSTARKRSSPISRSKSGKSAFVNRACVYNYQSHSIASINGLSGNFPQGGSINQSVQQDIIRGYKPTEGETPEGGANPVTLLCRKAAAASPSTCPVPRPGGSSHPVLYNDSKLCNDLFWSRKTITRALSRH